MSNEPNEQAGPAAARAKWVTCCFAVFALLGIARSYHRLDIAWPQIIFYWLLVWNDFYSIGYFSSFLPPNKISQRLIDGGLLIAHVLLVFCFSTPLYFQSLMALLFSQATLKYAYELPWVVSPERLYRKIKIDALGTVGCVVAIIGMLFGYVRLVAIAWTVLFAAASVYVILLRPLYLDTRKGVPDSRRYAGKDYPG